MENKVVKKVVYFYSLSLLQHFRNHEDSLKVEEFVFFVKLVQYITFVQLLTLLET